MRDQGDPERSRYSTPTELATRRPVATAAVGAVVAAVMVAALVGVSAGGAAPTAAGDDNETAVSTATDGGGANLSVTDRCTEDGAILGVENPTDEPVALGLAWTTDDPSLSVRSEGPASTQISTTTSVEGSTQTAEHTLNTTVPADGDVAVAGLADGTYNLSAGADGTDVALDRTEVALECGPEGDGTTIVLSTLERYPTDD